VQRAIYKSYASLASSIQENLKDKFYVRVSDQRKKAQLDQDTMFTDLQQFLDPLHNKQNFCTQYKLSAL